ncbi:MAG: M16 family metallopeptidase [Planctomycetota bacterium]
MAEEFYVEEFGNGLTLLGQPMDQVSSAAMTVALAGGAGGDPAELAGAASVGAHWLLRGAGERDTRQLNAELDALGCRHHEDAQNEHLVLAGALLGDNLTQALGIFADILRRPHLAAEAFAACRDLVAQELESLEDEPMRKSAVMIREQFYPQPLGRCPLGSSETLAAMTAEVVGAHIRSVLTPAGMLMAVAGRFRWEELVEAVGELFGDWTGPAVGAPETAAAERGMRHVVKPTAQAQIVLAYPAETIHGERYYPARLAQMVLSGGMSSRLFTEVREKRALVYAVGARYHSLKDHAGMFVYAGTTPQRAQETLDVTVGELRRLGEGVAEEEMARSKTQLKSALVMQGESTSARADALAGDWYHLRRLRSLKELSDAVDAVTADQVVEYTRAWPADELTVLTIGPDELDTSAL